jgi:homoserine kinase
MFLSTEHARGILSKQVNLSDVVWQMANLAGFLAGCYTSDFAMIREAFEDVSGEPQRAALMPGCARATQAALAAGALGCSISGAGPSVFAWSQAESAVTVRDGMLRAFSDAGLECDHWIAPVGGPGARLLERP